ncbi:MAG: TIGR02270 family protein [Pseudomonadota bacterium]
MSTLTSHHVTNILTQHAEEAVFLWLKRSYLVHAPHVALRHLARNDNRLAAHIDGLRVAGDEGWKLCEGQLSSEESGEMFPAMLMALESKQQARIDKLFALAEAVPAMRSGLHSTFGWVSAQFLQGTVKDLLASSSPFRRLIAIACCTLHRVDAGKAIIDAIRDSNVELRARALRAAGELGRIDLLTLCEQHTNDKDIACQFWSAWSSAILGERKHSIETLKLFFTPGPFQERALQLALKVMPLNEAHAVLKSFASHSADKRMLVKGAGIAGDSFYVSWLIKQMETLKLTRLAGEAFSLITGLDLALLDLDRKPPENFESGPNDDPNDVNVAMDEDENLPWPDPEKIQAWWNANQHRFQNGVRYFMGEPVNVEQCKKVLLDGFQRQRGAAALYLSLLQLGTPLFPTSAPAWRQQRWLVKRE